MRFSTSKIILLINEQITLGLLLLNNLDAMSKQLASVVLGIMPSYDTSTELELYFIGYLVLDLRLNFEDLLLIYVNLRSLLFTEEYVV